MVTQHSHSGDRLGTVGNNSVAGAEVGALIQSVFDTQSGLAANEPVTAVWLTPAVPILLRTRQERRSDL